MFPCSPSKPSVVITTRTLEYYRVMYLRCPRLSVQPFVKSLCDIHGVPFKPYLSQQLTICFDLYLNILSKVKFRVHKALERTDLHWRLKNTCPACEYRLEDEVKLKFSMMCCMDGNDSLKRLERRYDGINEDGEVKAGPSNERLDERIGGHDYFLSNEEVDKFGKAVAKTIIEELTEKDSPCMPRWKNMDEKATASMWGIFDETGVFLCLCRHGFALVFADMVRSGEQAKYALAVANLLMDTLGKDLAAGYDIGCGFEVTISKSTIGTKAKEMCYTSLVGTFHGHAHCRLCQVDHLGTYVEGNGLEDSEGCERFFSKSNALASSVRYCSLCCAEHIDDFETYANLTNFLHNNYVQALEICGDYKNLLNDMKLLGIPNEGLFKEWLAEEREYLKGLKQEPEEETVQMEYYQVLVELERVEGLYKKINEVWLITEDPISGVDHTLELEAHRRHTTETRQDLKSRCQLLERKLGISVRWKPGSDEWDKTKLMVQRQCYRKCVDRLESLVVAHLFELSRMHRAHTGYKLRKHMGKALQARSQAIRTALTNYNDAAAALDPPGRQLDWESVVECTFLADFDLLCDVRRDVRDQEWADPAKRVVMDRYFKICRAREEIQRLNVEIRRVATYLCDEEAYLLQKEKELAITDPDLAHQIRIHRHRRGRFNEAHWRQLQETANLPGFSGTLKPGVGKLSSKRSSKDGRASDTGQMEQEGSGDEADKEYEELEGIIQVSQD
ncbi:hypothetical protein K435DRAFT_824088 [Dendrothele bispora CBS 962.96]|uniref:CxC1-like cysteine cluster associated with KDZ transposases domain-containing protein n=2 Tax=Dendrothele bispora (strain CBS 962.96) TaxID=1314807 RepID=A0A4S8KSG8_DENBC|nr:hypothetical protein K435DRAFT_824088 [Dendrothele bispora CBS 962.96]